MQMFVRPFDENLSRALNLHLSFLGQSQVSLRSVSIQSEVSLRSVLRLEALLTHFVVQSEPKILRLVLQHCIMMMCLVSTSNSR